VHSGAERPPLAVAGYRLLRVLGSGAHGQVVLAEHLASARPVALKLIPLQATDLQQQADAFLASARVAQRLQHPDIVAVHAAGVQDGLGWLDMELVPGCSLERYARPGRLLPEALVLRVAARVARALHHAHSRGVVHRDVKPANILVDWAGGLVKLADFGLARADDSQQTSTGIVPGSPAYMAPELLAGQLPTPRSDLYALGVTLFQLLTGQLPHEGATMGELLRRVSEDSVLDACQLRPELAPALGELLQRLLNRHAERRPADAAALATEMEALANSLAPTT
jgi:eukaryotic-like serine/threonine-protein kinase